MCAKVLFLLLVLVCQAVEATPAPTTACSSNCNSTDPTDIDHYCCKYQNGSAGDYLYHSSEAACQLASSCECGELNGDLVDISDTSCSFPTAEPATAPTADPTECNQDCSTYDGDVCCIISYAGNHHYRDYSCNASAVCNDCGLKANVTKTYEIQSGNCSKYTNSTTASPSTFPTSEPTIEPIIEPTIEPTTDPTVIPTNEPTTDPSNEPSYKPTDDPTKDPTAYEPTYEPFGEPTNDPSFEPSDEPTHEPTTATPTTDTPTPGPTSNPTAEPITKTPTKQNECKIRITGESMLYISSHNSFQIEYIIEVFNDDCLKWNDLRNCGLDCLSIVCNECFDETDYELNDYIDDTNNAVYSIQKDSKYSISFQIEFYSQTINDHGCPNNDIDVPFEPGNTYELTITTNYSTDDDNSGNNNDYFVVNDELTQSIIVDPSPDQVSCDVDFNETASIGLFDQICFYCIPVYNDSSNTLQFNIVVDGILVSSSYYDIDEYMYVYAKIVSESDELYAIVIDSEYPDSRVCYNVTIPDIIMDVDYNDSSSVLESCDDELNGVDGSSDTNGALNLYIAVQYHLSTLNGESENDVSGEIASIVESMIVNIVDSGDSDSNGATVDMTDSESVSLALKTFGTLGVLVSDSGLISFVDTPDAANDMVAYTTTVMTEVNDQLSGDDATATDAVSSDTLTSYANSVNGILCSGFQNIDDNDAEACGSSDENADFCATFLTAALHSSSYAAKSSLLLSIPSASYFYDECDGYVKAKAKKIAIDVDDGETEDLEYWMDDTSIEWTTDQSGTVDCVIAKSSFTDGLVAASRRRRRRRRRLGSGDNDDNDFNITSDLIVVEIYNVCGNDTIAFETCDPILIEIPMNNDTNTTSYAAMSKIEEYLLGKDGEIDEYALELVMPLCYYWNESIGDWDDIGCYVYSFDISSNRVVCACNHLTIFGLSSSDFAPQMNSFSNTQLWRTVTISNIFRFPVIPIVMISVTAIALLSCVILSDEGNKPLLAYDDVLYNNFRKDMLSKTQHGKEIEILHFDKYAFGVESVWRLFAQSIKLFVLYSRNEHTFLSLFQRTAGTNYSRKQRIAVFFTYVLSILAFSALFYGFDISTPGTIIVSFYQSLGAFIPCDIMFRLFSYAYPTVKESETDKKLELIAADQSSANSDNNDSEQIQNDSQMEVELCAIPAQTANDTTNAGESNQNADNDNADSDNDSEHALNDEIDDFIDGPQTTAGGDVNVGSGGEQDDGEDVWTFGDMVSDNDINDVEITDKQDAISALAIESDLQAPVLPKIGKRNKGAGATVIVSHIRNMTELDVNKLMAVTPLVSQDIHAMKRVTNEIRNRLMSYYYPYPHYCRKVSWVFVVVWCVMCWVTAFVFGVNFDAEYEYRSNLTVSGSSANESNPLLSECWYNSFEYSFLNNVSFAFMSAYSQSAYVSEMEANGFNSDDASLFGSSLTDSSKWLISLSQSLILALFVWQPIQIYVLTWLKLYAFYNDLRTEISVNNFITFVSHIFFCKCVCCAICCRMWCSKWFHRSVLNERNQKQEANENEVTVDLYSELSTPISQLKIPGHAPLFSASDDAEFEKASAEFEKAGLTPTSKLGARSNTFKKRRPLDINSFFAMDHLFVND